jgi:hypothetical protein
MLELSKDSRVYVETLLTKMNQENNLELSCPTGEILRMTRGPEIETIYDYGFLFSIGLMSDPKTYIQKMELVIVDRRNRPDGGFFVFPIALSSDVLPHPRIACQIKDSRLTTIIPENQRKLVEIAQVWFRILRWARFLP